jgi:hypothetical protein
VSSEAASVSRTAPNRSSRLPWISAASGTLPTRSRRGQSINWLDTPPDHPSSTLATCAGTTSLTRASTYRATMSKALVDQPYWDLVSLFDLLLAGSDPGDIEPEDLRRFEDYVETTLVERH